MHVVMTHLPSARPKKNHECKGGHGRLSGEQKAAKMGFEASQEVMAFAEHVRQGNNHTWAK